MKVAVAGLGWWGKQIISCLEKSPRFEVLYGVDPSPPDDVAAFRREHPFPLEADLDTALADPAVEGVILGNAPCVARGAGAPRHRRRQGALLREAAHHDR